MVTQQRPRLARKLQLRLLDVVAVEVQVAKSANEIARLQPANLCDHGFADGSQESTIFRFPEWRIGRNRERTDANRDRKGDPGLKRTMDPLAPVFGLARSSFYLTGLPNGGLLASPRHELGHRHLCHGGVVVTLAVVHFGVVPTAKQEQGSGFGVQTMKAY